MSGVKRYNWTHTGMVEYGESDLLGQRCWVLASDYDACASRLHEVAEVCAIAEQERDALRAQVEAMRSALCKFTSLGIVSCNWDEMDDALRYANAALQAKP